MSVCGLAHSRPPTCLIYGLHQYFVVVGQFHGVVQMS